MTHNETLMSLPVKEYHKPTLKEHSALKQITFSGHGSPEDAVVAVRELPGGNFEVQYRTGDPVEMVPADARLKIALAELFDPMSR
ncbi:MAG TPA: hypothetical protein VFG51_03910 [Candidatus Saccharimonadia bacterium]|nr:hypothetical protein [Candidatus Saccharimonadia bacterium]